MSAEMITPDRILCDWARKELTFKDPVKRGDKGAKAKLVQEWLCLNGNRVVIDGGFGPATESAVRLFQQSQGLEETGVVDSATFQALTAPMLRVLATPSQYNTYTDLVVQCAQQHLAENPREVGGPNCGPWVRLYMQGNQGASYPWCAGFVSFILKQAAGIMKVSMPLKYTYSCDTLAAQAMAKGSFVSEKDLARGKVSKTAMSGGSIFLRRRTKNDWEHTGLVMSFGEETFGTIEGNTNDDGSREGFEVCERTQAYASKDFIKIA